MAAEEGFKIASAFVEVEPDTEGFAEKLRAAIKEAVDSIDAKVKVGADVDEALAEINRVKAARDELTGDPAEVKVGADTGEASAGLDKLKAKRDDLTAGPADVKIGADGGAASAEMDDIKAKKDELGATETTVPIGADDDEAKATIADLQSELARLRLASQGVEIGADATPAEITIAGLEAQIRALRAKITLDADDAPAEAAVGELEMQLRVLRLQRQGITVDADISPAELKLAELQAEYSALRAEMDKASSIEPGGSGGGLFAGGMPGGMMTYLAGGLTSVLPGIAGAATGLGELAGTSYLAFGGIAKALEAHKEASQNVGQTSAELASTEFQDSVQIQQAQEAIGQAHRQAAEDAVTSAQAISSAEANLTEAERNASASQVQAVQAVGQAQQQLQQANFGLAQAQYNLSMAWIQAKFNLEQLNDAERDSATTIAAAKLAVAQAQYQQTLTDQNAFSTQLDRQQAAIAVAQAEEALTSAQQQATETAKEAHLEDKKGVAGSQTVVTAQEAVREAVDAVRDAQQQMADAQRNLTDTELNNAEQVRQAQLSVVQAQQQAAYQQENDAIAVEQAQKNLTDTLREQQLQQAATASTANSAANQFAKDMAKLSPAGREMTRMILGISSAFGGMERIAQKAVAPGMVQFLRGVKDLLPDITFGVKLMGGSISRAFGQFGKEMQKPWFSDVFKSLLTEGNQFINTVLPAFGRFIQELAIIGSQKGAVTGLANILAGIGNGLTAVVKALGPFTGALSSVLSSLGSALRPIGTLFGTIVGTVATALAPLLRAVLPSFVTLAGDLASGLQQLAPLLGQLAAGAGQALAPMLAGIVQAAQPLITALVQGLKPVITALVPILSQFGAAMGQQGNLIAVTMRAVAPLLPMLGQMLGWFLELITPVLRLTAVMNQWFVTGLSVAIKGVGDLVSAIAGWMGSTSDWEHAWDTFTSALSSAWNTTWSTITHIGDNFYQWLWSDFGAKIETFFTQTVPSWWDTFTHATQSDLIGPVQQGLGNLYTWIWTDFGAKIRNFFVDTLPGWFGSSVSGIGREWGKLEGFFRGPVNFLINTVYDNGIRRLWDDVAAKIPGVPPLPHISGLARGGITPGTDRGKDEYLMPMRPGEGVLTPKTVQGIGGPASVYALNNYHDSASNTMSSHGGIGHTMGKLVTRELRKHTVERGAEHLIGLAHGGVVGNIGNFLGGIGHDVLSGIKSAYDIGRMIAALTTGNGTALANGMDALIHTKASGDLGKMMTGVPKALVGDLAKLAVKDASSTLGGGGGMGTGSQGGLGGSAKGSQLVQYAESFIGRVPYVYGGTTTAGWDCSGFTEDIYRHFGFSPPRTSEEQWNWVERTPSPVLGGLAFFAGSPIDPPPGHVGIITGSNQMVDAYGTGFGTRLNSIYGSSGTVFGFGVPPGGGLSSKTLDQGGYLTGPPNFTGQPERVLTPRQTDAFDRLVDWLTTHGSAGAASPGATVTQNFFGTQLGPEQRAEIKREMGMALSGP